MGSMYQRQDSTDVVNSHLNNYSFTPGAERMSAIGGAIDFTQAYAGQTVDSVVARYDQSGNTILYGTHSRVVISSSMGPTLSGPQSHMGAASYYGADEKLRFYSRSGTATSRATRTVFEEYRYDALGRSVLVRSQADSSASGLDSLALTNIDRFVWDGDQILYEIRQRGYHGASDATLEDDHGATPSYAEYFGIVGYTHGGALDRPVALMRNGSQLIIPHAGHNGEYDYRTLTSGASGPTDINWPGSEMNAYHEENMTAAKGWAGSLIRDNRDESGLKYMRNRYYDSRSGRFTQEDPIGLAGGMNLYGFAAGDPVSYSDPFGLCPPEDKNDGPECKRVFFAGVSGSAIAGVGGAGGAGLILWSGEEPGIYVRGGGGFGGDVGGGGELGTSTNLNAFKNWSDGASVSLLGIGGSLSTNSSGTWSITPGPRVNPEAAMFPLLFM